ncbi:MAG: GGDEF domain-containing protein [Thermodesulfobacteriaceae bacterium]|nr:GGDEF domain-containing protein [Thermodesulfobacteriaceae bacterium]
MTINSLFKKYPELIFNSLSVLKNLIIVLVDENYKIIDSNEGLKEILGLEEKPLNSDLRNLLIGVSKENLGQTSLDLIELILKGKDKMEIVLKGVRVKLEDKYLLILEPYRLTYSELILKLSKLNEQLVNITRELAKKNVQLSEALKTIKKINNTDPLTGILNRRAFLKILKREISLAKRHNLPLSLVMIDIDYFKKINDTYGHETGDYVLKSITKVIKKSIRQEDLFARLGGEEFVLLLPHTNMEAAYKMSERLRQTIEKRQFKRIREKITASFGITEFSPLDNFKLFLKRADEALYEAKKRGRNCCICIYR